MREPFGVHLMDTRCGRRLAHILAECTELELRSKLIESAPLAAEPETSQVESFVMNA